jgi:hypothetical protein
MNTDTIDTLGALCCLPAVLSYVYMARYLAPRDLSPAVLSAAQLVAAKTKAVVLGLLYAHCYDTIRQPAGLLWSV